jgi:hypothetical protein
MFPDIKDKHRRGKHNDGAGGMPINKMTTAWIRNLYNVSAG